MKFYKILKEGAFIGVVYSGQFLIEYPETPQLFYANEKCGQYVLYGSSLYRDYWMAPIVNYARDFIMASIIEITEEEYNIYHEAIINNETIEEETQEEEEEIIPDVPVQEEIDASIAFLRTSKLNEMSYTCRKTIEAGFDLELRGTLKHFSLDTQDQLNLITLSTMAQTQTLIPYHADSEACIFYTQEEINEIVETATAFKIYHTTYYNALKAYINALNTVEEISAIEYGVEIPEEYQTDVLKALQS